MQAHSDPTRFFRSWNKKTSAFVSFDETQLEAQSEASGTNAPGVSGLTVGVKDIIDVAGFATRNGSETCRDAAPADRDADVVAALRNAGARIVGKTTSTEFAFTDPTDCRNPYDLNRSPGGSSSGSGAAVAAGLVDLALGTQTAGSLCRPAAYCGVIGFKPSYGLLSTRGVTPLAPSFDAVGVIARSVDIAERAFQAMQPASAGMKAEALEHCAVAPILLDTAQQTAPAVMEAFNQSLAGLGGLSRRIATPRIDIDIAHVVADHRVIMHHEAAIAHADLLAPDQAMLLKPKFRAGLQAGIETSTAEAQAIRARLLAAKAAFWQSVQHVDILLTLPVPDVAPLIDGTTGFQDWLTPWTVFGGPLVCMPWGMNEDGLPCSVMLAAHPGNEATLLKAAKALVKDAPALASPALPAE